MSQLLIKHSPDLLRLQSEGYVIEIRNNFLFVYRVPYLNSKGEVLYGTLVSNLQVSGNRTTPKPNHTVWFAGDLPHRRDLSPLSSIINNSKTQIIAGDFEVHHYLSNKPQTGYINYYHKMTNYINMISPHAKVVDPTASEKAPPISNVKEESVFQYMDTNSSKPELSVLNQVFLSQKIGIVGLGGTGSYILDAVCKTPVKEIHLHDGDWFYNNNAFRAPGAASLDKLIVPQRKVDYYCDKYSHIHKGIQAHSQYINLENMNVLLNYDFVFLSLDKGPVKKNVIKLLEQHKIPFIDVGMGIQVENNALTGILRTTTAIPGRTNHIWESNNIPFQENEENEYSSNIQIVELNMLNAAYAVIKWKKILKYYHDLENEHTSFYILNSNKIINEQT